MCRLIRHTMTIMLNEAEWVCGFVRRLTLSTRSYVLKAPRKGSFFHSIVSTTKEVELIVMKEFGHPMIFRSSSHISSSSSRGRGSHRGVVIFSVVGMLMPPCEKLKVGKTSLSHPGSTP